MLIATIEGVDSTKNLAVPAGVDLVIPFAGRVRLRAGIEDLLHRCDSPPGLEGIICEDGEWLHHVATSLGVEFGF